MNQSARRVEAIKQKMDSLKEAKVPTEEYVLFENSIKKVKFELDALVNEQNKLIARGLGKDADKEYLAIFKTVKNLKNELQQAIEVGDKDAYLGIEDRLNRAKSVLQEMMAKNPRPLGDIAYYESITNRINKLKNDISGAETEMKKLVDSGKAFSVDANNPEYQNLASKLQNELAKQKELNASYDIAKMKLEKVNRSAEKLPGIFSRTLTAAKKAFSGLSSAVKKVDGLLGRLAEKAKAAFASITKSSDASGNAVSSFGKRIRSLLLSMLVFEQIRKGLNAVFGGMQESFKNFASYSAQTNRVMSDLYSALATLKNALASAFAPIVNIAVPYLTTLINYVTKAVNAVAQLIAALTGQTSWKRAKKQTVDYAGALDKTAASAKKAAGALAGFDDLDVLNKRDNDTGADAGGADVSDMWEDVPIDSKFMEMAEKIKEILSKLFAPLLEAWKRQGEAVMKAWKFALKEIWSLIKDIGRDFLTVWNEEATIAVLENILLIIADIGLVIGNLAKNFREAWNENNVGLRILENIRDIFAVIIANIKEAADYTVKWAENLDFGPLLEAFERFTASLVPAVDNLSGVLSDFYTMVLLPLGKWVLEKGLPDLLDVFTAFNERVDWEKLRSNLAEFWKHLEPFAERVGEGLILFIEDISVALADFLNSEAFESFLQTVENWMDNVDAEDVAKTLKNIAEKLIALKIAVLGFKAVESVISIIKRIGDVLNFLTGGGLAAGLKGLGPAISEAIAGFGGIGGLLTADIGTTLASGSFAAIGLTIGTAIIGGIVAAVAGWNLGQLLNEAITGEEIDMSFFEQMSAIKESFSDGSWKEALSLWASDIGNAFLEMGNTIVGWWNETIVPFFSGVAEWFDTWVVQPIKTFLQDIFNFVGTIWNGISTTISAVLNVILTAITTVLNTIKTIWNTVWGVIKTVVSTIWDGIKTTISTVINVVKTVITVALNAIKTVWNTIWTSLKTTVVSVFNGIKSVIKGVINGILGFVESMVNGIINGINKMIDALNSLKFSIPSWVPSIGGKSFGFNLGKVPSVKLPRLAEGAVFRGGNPYAAIVNDQPKGQTNIEAPLNTIKQAVSEVMSSLGNNSTPSIQIFIGNEQLDDYIVTAGSRGALRSGGF